MKIYCNVCSKYRKIKYPKILFIFLKKTLSVPIVYNKCGHKYGKIFKEEESIKVLKIFSLITNKAESQKTYNHVWRRHKSRI